VFNRTSFFLLITLLPYWISEPVRARIICSKEVEWLVCPPVSSSAIFVIALLSLLLEKMIFFRKFKHEKTVVKYKILIAVLLVSAYLMLVSVVLIILLINIAPTFGIQYEIMLPILVAIICISQMSFYLKSQCYNHLKAQEKKSLFIINIATYTFFYFLTFIYLIQVGGNYNHSPLWK